MHKPWLVQYPAGVPAEIDLHEFASLTDVLASTCARFADLPAYNSMGTAMTYRQLDAATDAAEIVQAFERLSQSSRYGRFMQHKKQLDDATLQRGVHPRPGHDFAFVATIAADDGIDIVGAAQYVRAEQAANERTCEFAITVAEDWRGSGLATELLASLLRRARRDGYATMEGWVIAGNAAMLALARKLGFKMEPVAGDATVLRVQRAL